MRVFTEIIIVVLSACAGMFIAGNLVILGYINTLSIAYALMFFI